MRKSILFICCLALAGGLFAQSDTIQPPYKRFPTYPPLKITLHDGTTYTKENLPKKKAVMLMLFNPSCDHCQHETETMAQNMDKFKDIQVVMVTTAPVAELLAFREKYQLGQYPNIVMGRDNDYFLFSFFTIHNFPFHAFYNKKKELISVFEGSMTLDKVLAQFDN